MPQLDIVLPVYNEEHVLAGSVEKLRVYLEERNFPYSWRIVIADNASTDGTLAAGEALAEQFADVKVIHLPQKGRGRALRKAWLESDADAACFMDIDLPTHLDGLDPPARALLAAGYDLATGEVIWECGGLSRNVVASPVASDGMVYAGSSYEKKAMLALRPDGAKGDISRTHNPVWRPRPRTPYVPPRPAEREPGVQEGRPDLDRGLSD